MRWGLLIFGSAVLALTATKALHHMVMVPVDRPEMWIGAIGLGLVCLGGATMMERR